MLFESEGLSIVFASIVHTCCLLLVLIMRIMMAVVLSFIEFCLLMLLHVFVFVFCKGSHYVSVLLFFFSQTVTVHQKFFSNVCCPESLTVIVNLFSFLYDCMYSCLLLFVTYIVYVIVVVIIR